MCAYVITSWHASNEPVDDEGHLVAIQLRHEGLAAWLLSRLESHPTVRLELSADELRVQEGSWSGQLHRIVPLENVCATVHGCRRPWRNAVGMLLTAAALGYTLLGLSQLLLSLVVVVGGTVLAGAYYVFSPALTLSFVETSGHVITLTFRRGRVGDEPIDEDGVAYIAGVTQALIDNRKSAQASSES